MFRPVTKWDTSIPKAEVIPEAVRKVFKIAQTKKPGATHVEKPEDVADELIGDASDGGFLMNSQELETAMRLKLPLVVLVWRDDGYGVIRWKQQVRFRRTSSVDFGNPDLVRYAESFGAVGYRVTGPSELRPTLIDALKSNVPVVIDCPVDYAENIRLTERLKLLPH